jgi:hypothetical protein
MQPVSVCATDGWRSRRRGECLVVSAVLCFEVISKSRVLPSTARPMDCSSSGLPRYWLHTTRRAMPGLLQPSILQARK